MKNGFTLVELLAVIVILAVLALIATPVVLSIIDDAKESAMLRSAEMYLSGVENAVMRENMNSGGNFRPNECTISNGNMTCGSTTVEVEVDGEVPYAGLITFENGKITAVTLNYESGTIVKDSSGNLVYSDVESEYKSICTLASDSTVAEGLEGAKYNCKVDPNKPEYTFYLLDNNEDGTSDLIMNANINASGEAVIPGVTSDTGKVAWYAEEAKNINGPVTAMTYLHNATKSWTNVEPLNYTYNDREVQGITGTDSGYQSFVSTNGIVVITKGDAEGTQVTIGSTSEPLRARMLIYSSDESISEVKNRSNAPYLYDNFGEAGMDPNGYWTLSSPSGFPPQMFYVYYSGGISVSGVTTTKWVRPVITVKL